MFERSAFPVHWAGLAGLLAIAAAGCGDSDNPYPLADLSRESARALPQVATGTLRAMDYSDDSSLEGVSAIGLLGKLFRMECHDGQAGGVNFCPAGVEVGQHNTFAESIVAQVNGVEFKLRDIYARDVAEIQACEVGQVGEELGGRGALGANGEPLYLPAGSDKFVLASTNTLDCFADLSSATQPGTSSAAYAKAEAGEIFAAVLTYREESAPAGQEASSAVHQLYVRKAAETTEVVAFNMVLYQVDALGDAMAVRQVLLLNIAEHRFVIKQRVNDTAVVGIGTAGYDADGNYFIGRNALRIIAPSNEVFEALTFCMDNDASLSLAAVATECDDMRDSFLDASSGAWTYVSAFLGLDDGADQDALVGFATLFDSGAMLPASELPMSLTDGFPASIGAQ